MQGVIYLDQDNNKEKDPQERAEGASKAQKNGVNSASPKKGPVKQDDPKIDQKATSEAKKTEVNKETTRDLPPTTVATEEKESTTFTPTTEKTTKNQEERENTAFTPTMQKYLQDYKHAVKQKQKTPENPIHVDEIASKIAKLYEKMRRVIDWKEEHLVRRTAIERILKRRLISEISEITILPDLEPAKIARPMTLEIIRTGYFENGKIPEDKIDEIEMVLKKYIHILKNSPYAKESALAIKTKVQFYNWILEVAACEIEEILDYPYKGIAMLEFMTEAMYGNLKLIPEEKLSEEDKYIQTYIAVHRTLYNLDEPVITFHVLKKRYPLFAENNLEFTKEFTENIESIWQSTKADLEHPKRGEFSALCEKYDAAYLILSDAMKQIQKEKTEDTPFEEFLAKPEKVAQVVKETYEKRLSTLKKRLYRSAFYSTLSIFVAGAASLFIFEYPVAMFFYGEFSAWAVFADIMIPTALMFFLVSIIRPPADDNLQRVQEEIKKIIYKEGERQTYKIKLSKKIKKVQNFFFTVMYLLGGFGSLYLIYWVFKVAGVPFTSLYIDTVNVAVVVFAAMVIRQKSKELSIKERTSILEFLLDFFSIPLARIGGWLSDKWKEFNFVSVFFSTLVDMPFSTFIEFLEGWRNFIKEKRARISQ
ncbi:hypothetical protein GF360_01765 [candidate division WWE3 bacterium]|nr:hypothetical protein [candidate division WWE3 bacterium]